MYRTTGRLFTFFTLLLAAAGVYAAEAQTLVTQTADSGEWSNLIGFGLAALGITGLILIRTQSSLL